jgi:enamine deaminase RidA (YjgF/YER057c/UK114 family)
VKVQVFLTDISERSAINPRRTAKFSKHCPASTLAEALAVTDPRMIVETECHSINPYTG